MKSVPVILLCDDDEDEHVLIRNAFNQAQKTLNLVYVRDGLELMGYLRRSGNSGSEEPRPDVIWLDFNMPRMDELQTLKWIKSCLVIHHFLSFALDWIFRKTPKNLCSCL